MNSKRLTRGLFLLACFAITLEAYAGDSPHKPSRPNVILFLVDDMGFGDLACHGNPQVKTPEIDSFARTAVEFSRFYVNPVCSPTRAALLTGRYNYRTGVNDIGVPIDCKEITLAESLRRSGYKTGIFGKWHLGEKVNVGPLPNDMGFDESLSFDFGCMWRQGYFNPTLLHNGKEEKYQGYCMDVFTNAAIQFMKENRDKPFFAYVACNLIHTPLIVPKELVTEYAGLGEKTQKINGMIRSVDNNFGRLRAALTELGLEENTFFIFMSDNGPCYDSVDKDRYMAGLHGVKATVYENGIRVPCYMRWPAGFNSTAAVSHPVAHIDVFPTLLEACGAKSPEGTKIDGTSLLPLLRNPAALWPERNLLFQSDGPTPKRGLAYGVIGEKWKLVQPCGLKNRIDRINATYLELCRLQGRPECPINGSPRDELYDLVADPGERKNLAAEHPEIVEQLKKRYDAWFTDVSPRIPVKKTTKKTNPVKSSEDY